MPAPATTESTPAADAAAGASGVRGSDVSAAPGGAPRVDDRAGAAGGVVRAADRCPGVLRLHDAGDGLLARVRLPGGRIDRRGLATLADGAALGNGLAELTSRASVQLRGLPPEASAPLASLLAAGGLLLAPARPRAERAGEPAGGAASPRLADAAAPAPAPRRSLLPTDALVTALDAAILADPALAELPGRFLFALDDGAGLVDLAAADVALRGGRRARR